jgi:hypothetical protein
MLQVLIHRRIAIMLFPDISIHLTNLSNLPKSFRFKVFRDVNYLSQIPNKYFIEVALEFFTMALQYLPAQMGEERALFGAYPSA